MTHSIEEIYHLRLYVAGLSSRSSRAIVNVRSLCEEHLHGRYELQVIDISLYPVLARSEQLVAAPTLVKDLPLPARRFVGDMSQTDRLLRGLGVAAVTSGAAAASDGSAGAPLH